jgi:predicted phage terminase large subunit-like protein
MNGIDPKIARLALDEACRRSFFLFVQRFYPLVASGVFEPNWHHELLCHEFEKIFWGEQRRLLVTIAPRTLKSVIASVLFPAWALGHNPKLEIVCASYSMELAVKLARYARVVMRDPNYRRIFPNAVIKTDHAAAHDFALTAGGSRRAVSIGGTFTGIGGDYIICDDLMNALEASSKAARDTAGEWVDSVMRTRLNNPLTGAIAIVAQRLHQDDPIGRILEREGHQWNLIDIPAIAETRQTFDLGRGKRYVREVDEVLEPARMPREKLDEQRLAIGTAAFNAQYQQRPVPEQGNLVRREWFKDYDFDPRHRDPRMSVHQSWDLAMKTDEQHDYSACITFGVAGNDFRKGDLYILNVYREKLMYPDLRRKIISMSLDWHARSVLIEDMGSGVGMIQDLRREGVVRPIPYKPIQDKITRLSLQSAVIEQGRVFLPIRLQWAQDFLAEVLAFPNGKHDDQLDALTQFLDYVDGRARRTVHHDKW